MTLVSWANVAVTSRKAQLEGLAGRIRKPSPSLSPFLLPKSEPLIQARESLSRRRRLRGRDLALKKLVLRNWASGPKTKIVRREGPREARAGPWVRIGEVAAPKGAGNKQAPSLRARARAHQPSSVKRNDCWHFGVNTFN